jgi:G3E family GTPase
MQIGIDDALLSVQTAENIVEMNNGCICCTVRGDLVRSARRVLPARELAD